MSIAYQSIWDSPNAPTLRDTASGKFLKNHVSYYKCTHMVRCSYCDILFEKTRTRVGANNYCSWECYAEYKRSKSNKVSIICKTCGKVFLTSPARFKENRGKYCSKECCFKAMKGREAPNKNKTYEEILGIPRALLVKEQIANISRKFWKDSDYVKKQMKARRARPNHQEQFMDRCFPFLQYVGDGKLIIGGKCPDFKVIDQKKVVELFGNYWHKPSEVEERIAYFKKCGWSCLVVWNSELRSNFAETVNKLNTYVVSDK